MIYKQLKAMLGHSKVALAYANVQHELISLVACSQTKSDDKELIVFLNDQLDETEQQLLATVLRAEDFSVKFGTHTKNLKGCSTVIVEIY